MKKKVEYSLFVSKWGLPVSGTFTRLLWVQDLRTHLFPETDAWLLGPTDHTIRGGASIGKAKPMQSPSLV